MLSVLLPSRGRPELFRRCVDSLRNTSLEKVEILVYLDNNDPKIDLYIRPPCERKNIRFFSGEPLRPAQAIRKLAEFSEGKYMMFLGDDHVFVTNGWDKALRKALPKDGVGVTYAEEKHGKNPFFTKNFYDLCEIDSRFQHFGPDTWLVEIAEKLNRSFPVPVIIEHRRIKNGYDLNDDTYKWGREVIEADKSIYKETSLKREEIWKRLKK